MFESIMNFLKKITKKEDQTSKSKDAAKERLHLVLMQDRANVSADFLELMKQEIIEVIKKYIDVDETSIDVRLTNKDNGDGTTGAPALYANIPIVSIKEDSKKMHVEKKDDTKKEDVKEEKTVENKEKVDAKKEEKEVKEEKKENIKEASKENKKEIKEEIANTKKQEKQEQKDNEEKVEKIKQEENKETKKEENKNKENTNKAEVK